MRVHRKLLESVAEGGAGRAAGLVERLREIKDEDELRRIAAAAELADEVYELLRERRGRPHESDVARELEQELRERGAEPAFQAIVASGPHGALPHAVPDAAIEPGTLMIDMGAKLDGYCSDCTRTFAIGDVGGRAIEVYDLVLAAQRAALGAVRDGAGCPDVDAVARDLIDAAGFAEEFGHGLGHGVAWRCTRARGWPRAPRAIWPPATW